MALGHEVYSAHQAVEHDDANVIAMGAWLVAAPRGEIGTFLGKVRQRRGHRPPRGQTAGNRTAQRRDPALTR